MAEDPLAVLQNRLQDLIQQYMEHPGLRTDIQGVVGELTTRLDSHFVQHPVATTLPVLPDSVPADLFEDTCEECGGASISGNRSHLVPEQPADSRMCSACWWNTTHPDTPLPTLDELDEDDTDLAAYVGKLVDWHATVGKLVELYDGYYIEVQVVCARCKQQPQILYAGAGLHAGAWAYVYEKDEANGRMNYLGCIRDQEYKCEDCSVPA